MYYFQIWNEKEHNRSSCRIISSHMGLVNIETHNICMYVCVCVCVCVCVAWSDCYHDKEMDSANRVEILDDVVSISLYPNLFERGMNQSILLQQWLK